MAAWIAGKGDDLQALSEAVERMNRPACVCARDKITGHDKWPWETRDIEIVAGDLLLPLGDAMATTNPVTGKIFVNWGRSAGEYAASIGHEAGHLWWPYLGGPQGDFNAAFGTSHTWSPKNYGASSICGASRAVQEECKCN